MVKVKLSELNEIMAGLTKLGTIDMPVKTGYRFAKLARKIDTEIKDFETMRIKLINKYVEKDENSNPQIDSEKKEFIFTEENRKLFENEFKPLLDTEVDIDFEPQPINNLGEDKIEYPVLIVLEKFIIDEQVIQKPTLIRS